MKREALTIRQRIRDIDFAIALLRAEQKGLEVALSIVRGESALTGRDSMIEDGQGVKSGLLNEK